MSMIILAASEMARLGTLLAQIKSDQISWCIEISSHQMYWPIARADVAQPLHATSTYCFQILSNSGCWPHIDNSQYLETRVFEKVSSFNSELDLLKSASR